MTGHSISPITAVLVMMFVTYFTRVSGVLILKFFNRNETVVKFCRYISGSVIIAIIVPPLISGDLIYKGAVLVGTLFLIFTSNSLVAMLSGVIFTIWMRAYA
jgi:uncharacterized membrane protein